MVTRIQNPFNSSAIVLILNRIHEIEQPYASMIANSLGEQVTDIQTYMDTMHDNDWITKERQGRRQILKINPVAIWKDSRYYRKLTSSSIFSEEDDKSREELDQLLGDALLYKLFYAVETTNKRSEANSVSGDKEVWVKGPDTLLDRDELVWYVCDTTLNDILAEIFGSLKTLTILTDRDDQAIQISTSAYDSKFIHQCQKTLTGEDSGDKFGELVQDMVENPEKYV